MLSALKARFPGISDNLAERLSRLADIDKLLSKQSVIDAINGLPAGKRERFFESMTKDNSFVKPPDNLLKNHIGQIDEQIVEVWRKLDATGNDNKKVDFEFLKENKGRTQEQIRNALDNANIRLEQAARLEATRPAVAEFLRESANSALYRGRLLSSISEMFGSGGSKLDEFIEFYRNDGALHSRLSALRGKPAAEVRQELETIFKGADFNAHHIVPANLLYNNEVLQDILEWAAKNGKSFDFNDIDNLVFLRLGNHTDGAYGHNIYDRLIDKEILGLENVFKNSPSEAFNQLQSKIKKYQNGIKDQLIGTQKKLDNLNASQLK